MAISDFPKKSYLPKKLKNEIFIQLTKSKFSKILQKNVQFAVEPRLDIRHAKFQVDISFLAKI